MLKYTDKLHYDVNIKSVYIDLNNHKTTYKNIAPPTIHKSYTQSMLTMVTL